MKFYLVILFFISFVAGAAQPPIMLRDKDRDTLIEVDTGIFR